MDNKHLRIATFNSKGHGADRIDYIKQILTTNEVLFIQEHWYFDSGMKDFEAQFDGFSLLGISGIDENEVLSGRPYGGCAIIYNNLLKCTAQPIDIGSKRCMACIITIDEVNFLFINVYMPCDLNVHSTTILYQDVLHDIDSCISNHDDIEYVIIGGDLNTDVTRLRSNHTNALRAFCQRNDLQLCLELSIANVDFTYESVTWLPVVHPHWNILLYLTT